MASAAESDAASRAGEKAEKMAMPSPTMNASMISSGVSEMGAGRLLTYRASTVLAINFTAPIAMTRPSRTPTAAPATPKKTDSATNATRIAVRVAPKARRIPISPRRRTTDTAMVL